MQLGTQELNRQRTINMAVVCLFAALPYESEAGANGVLSRSPQPARSQKIYLARAFYM
jgi:hypothetical protein